MCGTKTEKSSAYSQFVRRYTAHNISINIKYDAVRMEDDMNELLKVIRWLSVWTLFLLSRSLSNVSFSLVIFCFRFCFCFRLFERRTDFKISHVFEKISRIKCACVSSFI